MRVRSVLVAVLIAGQVLPQVAGASSDIWFRYHRVQSQRQLRVDFTLFVLAKGADVPDLRIGVPGGHQGPCYSLTDCVVYKTELVPGPDVVYRVQRQLSFLEVAEISDISPGSLFVEDMGKAMIDAQVRINEELGAQDGVGLIGRIWESAPPKAAWMSPFTFLAGGGYMLLDTADAMREAELSAGPEGGVRAALEFGAALEALAQLSLAGETTLSGHTAQRYSATDLGLAMDAGGDRQVLWNAADVYLDTDQWLLMGHRFEGTLSGDEGSQEFFVETMHSDFRRPSGCGDRIEPYRSVFRMGGLLTETQMAEIRKASEQVDELETQLAAMDESQRGMIEDMVRPQIEKLRDLADDGAFEYVQETREILCNPDLKSIFGAAGGGDGSRGRDIDAEDLVGRIQRHLVTLGYQPGNTDGELDLLTRIAISQFQAENALPVTGEPSPGLAAILAAEAARRA